MQDLHSRAKQSSRNNRRGFTIVELLIVVVVIAILAAITIVAYNGITANAKESALKSDLTTAAKKLHVAKVEDGSFPGAKPSFMSDNLTYTGGGSAFCVTGAANGRDFHIKESGSIEQGGCAAPVATTMQTFTSTHCSALATFTGSNNEAVIQLTDSRGGTPRTYDVAKLADGKCWMLTNLKLGSTSGAITLTPADSNVASNFTLPQLITGGSKEYDNPRAYGPVPSDGSGPTNYGYLYNWAAATAGATRATNPAGSGAAASSVCPINWRLPTGEDPSSDFGQLDIAFGGAGTGVSNGTSLSSWKYTGAFKGVFAGYWNGDFRGQGSNTGLWSASALATGNGNYSHYTNLDLSSVNPGNDFVGRYYGYGVRCLLN